MRIVSMQINKRNTLLALAALAGVFVAIGQADDKKGDVGKSEKDKVVKIASKAAPLATKIEFTKTFDLPLLSLTTLGSRIDHARMTCDPICLATAALELHAAEKVSGKKASLTADELTKEAVELAKLRRTSVELKALAVLLQEAPAAKGLTEAAAEAAKQEAADAAMAKAGERTRSLTGTLRCINNTNKPIQVYLNGNELCWVKAYREYVHNVYQGTTDSTVLTARSFDGSLKWGPYFVNYDSPNHTLTLNP